MDMVITGVDTVMNHHLLETNFTKEAYKEYIKDYIKSLKVKHKEQKPEKVKPFMTGAAEPSRTSLIILINASVLLVKT
jgi:hypothetical protein